MENAETRWVIRQQEWMRFIEGVLGAIDAGRTIPLGPAASPLELPARFPERTSAARVMFCAPHPDDESLSGAFALRLRLEAGARVTDVAVTLGSDPTQKARRKAELESACRALGFRLAFPPGYPLGFDGIYPGAKHENPPRWSEQVEALSRLFDEERPDAVLAPHAEDFNRTHIGTHHLVAEALAAHLARSGRAEIMFVETEFWHQLAQPNLVLGLTAETVAAQLIACGEHGGEMRRNPYHLRHVCRLIDNVRRGSEVVGGQGAPAQPWAFAELYRVRFARAGEPVTPRSAGLFIAPDEPIDLGKLTEHFGL
jgi:N-acetylglucosamine malate deacetylase 1